VVRARVDLLRITDDSLTGAVAAASLSAALALRVLRSVLEIASRKPQERSAESRLADLMRAADSESERLVQLAAEDSAAYAAYMQARKERSPQVQAALRRAIEAPLRAARSAAAGVNLCAAAAAFTRGPIEADVRGAAALLEGAVRAILTSVDQNLRAVEDEVFAGEVRTERHKLEERARAQAEKLLAVDACRP
jgi:methenyltetrahydrofolate cyclohydrolase